MKKNPAIVFCLFLATALTSIAQMGNMQSQDKSKRPSPPASATVSLNGATVTVNYGAPSMKGRKVFGGLVPYDKWWRTGANEATSLDTSAALDINGTTVPAGKYTLFTLPSEGTWKLIVSKKTGEWGTDYDDTQDLARIDMMKKSLSSPQEKMSITFENTKGAATELHVRWETTDAYIPIKKK